jgi:hypothetical protein
MSRGILARFETEGALREALAQLRANHISGIETYTPKPLQEESSASPLPLIVLIAGVLGALAAFAMQTLASTHAYPENIGGRPLFSWRAFIPITFEVGILCAVVAAVFGYFVINRMPGLYEPIDELDSMRHHAMCDGWLVAVRSDVPELRSHARGILEHMRPVAVEDIPG